LRGETLFGFNANSGHTTDSLLTDAEFREDTDDVRCFMVDAGIEDTGYATERDLGRPNMDE